MLLIASGVLPAVSTRVVVLRKDGPGNREKGGGLRKAESQQCAGAGKFGFPTGLALVCVGDVGG